MLKFLLRIALALSVLAVPVCANATLIEKSNFVSDTATGLDWLDFSETNGLAGSSVEAEMGAGGRYEGWRYANIGDVTNLFNDAGGNGTYDRYKVYGMNTAIAPTLLDLLGATRMADHFYRTASVHFKGNYASDLWGFRINENLSNSYYNSVYVGIIFATGGAEEGKAHALVRESVAEVPEPGSIALFALGIVSIGFFVRSRRGQPR